MLDRSPLASYSFTVGNRVNIHVCYQDPTGNIKQTFYDPQSRWHPSPNGIVGNADLNNGIAITGWNNGDEVYQVPTVCEFIACSHGLGTSLLHWRW